jgi:hypothetical protein
MTYEVGRVYEMHHGMTGGIISHVKVERTTPTLLITRTIVVSRKESFYRSGIEFRFHIQTGRRVGGCSLDEYLGKEVIP